MFLALMQNCNSSIPAMECCVTQGGQLYCLCVFCNCRVPANPRGPAVGWPNSHYNPSESTVSFQNDPPDHVPSNSRAEQIKGKYIVCGTPQREPECMWTLGILVFVLRWSAQHICILLNIHTWVMCHTRCALGRFFLQTAIIQININKIKKQNPNDDNNRKMIILIPQQQHKWKQRYQLNNVPINPQMVFGDYTLQ